MHKTVLENLSYSSVCHSVRIASTNVPSRNKGTEVFDILRLMNKHRLIMLISELIGHHVH